MCCGCGMKGSRGREGLQVGVCVLVMLSQGGLTVALLGGSHSRSLRDELSARGRRCLRHILDASLDLKAAEQNVSPHCLRMLKRLHTVFDLTDLAKAWNHALGG